MEVMNNTQLLPGDPRLVDHIVGELKSQGIFDQFRKECIADVDTKPAYQNLRQRVEGNVHNFLSMQKWKSDMNKNQLREMLRKNIQESGFLETGVERIVDQVVNPKINTTFFPQVEEVVYKFLGMEKPEKSTCYNRSNTKVLSVSTADLLPTDLDPISPASDKGTNQKSAFEFDKDPENDLKGDDDMNDSEKMDDSFKADDEESPPFEPIGETSFTLNDENTNDSNLSGISGLSSHESNHSPRETFNSEVKLNNVDVKLEEKTEKMHISDENHKNEIKLEISNEIESKIKPNMDHTYNSDNMDISTDSNDEISDTGSHSLKIDEDRVMEVDNNNESIVNDKEKDNTDIKTEESVPEIKKEPEEIQVNGNSEISKDPPIEIKEEKDKDDKKDLIENDTEKKSEQIPKDSEPRKSKEHRDSHDKKKERHTSTSSRSRDRERDHKSKSHKSDRDKDRKEIKKESDKDKKDDKRDKDKKDSKYREKDKDDKYKSKDSSRSSRDTSKKSDEKDKSSSSHSSKRSSSSHHDNRKSSSSSKDHSSSRDKSSNKSSSAKSSSSKDRREHSKDNSDKKHKDSKGKSDKHGKDGKDEKSSESERKSRDEKRRADKNGTDKSDHKHKDSKDRSDKDSKSKDSKHSSKPEQKHSSQHRSSSSSRDRKKDPKKESNNKKQSKDDHPSSRDKNNDNSRRSADRDSNDGSSGNFSQASSVHSTNSSKDKSSKEITSENINSQSGDQSSDSTTDKNEGKIEESNTNNTTTIKSPVVVNVTESTEITLNTSLNGITQPKKRQLDDSLDMHDGQFSTEIVDGQVHVKLKKPKFASNIFEARRLMKIRKRLEKLERKRQKQLNQVQKVGPSSPDQNSLDSLPNGISSSDEKDDEGNEASKIVPEQISEQTVEKDKIVKTEKVEELTQKIPVEPEAKSPTESEKPKVSSPERIPKENKDLPTESEKPKDSSPKRTPKENKDLPTESEKPKVSSPKHTPKENKDLPTESEKPKVSSPKRTPKENKDLPTESEKPKVSSPKHTPKDIKNLPRQCSVVVTKYDDTKVVDIKVTDTKVIDTKDTDTKVVYLSDSEDCLYLNPVTSPTTERFLKEVAAILKRGTKIGDFSETDDTLSDISENSNIDRRNRRSRKPNLKYCSTEFTSDIELNDEADLIIVEKDDKKSNNKNPKSLKRKSTTQIENTNEIIADLNENNNIKNGKLKNQENIINMDTNIKSPASSTNAAEPVNKPTKKTPKPRKAKRNSSSAINDSFVLPLSPESDISIPPVEIKSKSKEKEETPNKIQKLDKANKAAKAAAAQRYSSDDLYKPRPIIGSTRRSRAAQNQAIM